MARMEGLPEGEREMLRKIELPTFETTPFVRGKPLSKRRVAIISTAALQKRDDRIFDIGENSYRIIPGDVDPNNVVMSHGSANFDRTGFQQDLNICFPLERLHELAAEGFIGSVADFHYSVSGAVSPQRNEESVREIARLMKREAVDTVLLVPI